MASSGHSRWSRLRRWLNSQRKQRIWPTGVLYTTLALVATLSDTPRWYVADNRFEQYFNPSGVLSKMFAVWDPTRGLGSPRDDVWLVTTVPTALLRAAGMSPTLTERVFHAMVLVTFGLGVVALMRLFRPRLGPEHVLAGVLAMFSPYSASFLVPSNLFAMVAISPWFVVVFIRGMREDRPWRWAACFALLVFVAGNSDTPGLLYSGVMFAAAGLYVVVVERSATWRAVMLWLTRAGALALMCSSWMLAKTYFAAPELDARLVETEQPATSALASSWSESIRGLGNWLSYFREDGRLLKPQTVAYFEQPLIVMSTFVIPVVALVVLWRSRWPGRLLFGMMTVASLVVMVGGFGGASASPLGGSILWMFEHNTALASFRNTYKAGGGLVIGTSVLASVGAVGAYRYIVQRSRPAGVLALVVGAVVFVGAAFPFAARNMYHPFERVDAVPSYWMEAFDHLDALAVGGRSLIVPAVSQTEYRWGYVGDDLFDGLLDRPHATATGWMLSRGSAHIALEAITLAAQDPNYRPGVIGPMARRLGITEIVIRNDVDWRRANTARPAAFRRLRSDPDLELVATFGKPGTSNVVSRLDVSADAAYESTLPPVEIYRIRGATGLLTAETVPTLIVAGDAHSWPQLATAGLLDGDPLVAASAAMSDAQLRDELGRGAVAVVSDTARRRVRTLLRHEPQLSSTLADGEELDRPVRPAYPDQAGSESVAWYRDALTIEGSYVRFGGNRNDRRPSNAFDDDPATIWAVPSGAIGGVRPSLEVQLRRPTKIDRMVFRSSVSPDGTPTVAGLSVALSDGHEFDVDLDRHGVATVSFEPRVTSSLTISITDVAVFGSEVGLSEVSVEGLDLVEHIQTPADLTARDDPAIQEELRSSPVAYSFRRVARAVSGVRDGLESSRFDEEVTLKRRFEVVHDDEFSVSGTLRLLSSTSDEMIASVLEAPVQVVSKRPGGAQAEGAAYVIDGDARTSWIGGARMGTGVTLRVERQALQSVVVTVPADLATAQIRRVVIGVGSKQVKASLGSVTCVRRTTRVCTRSARAEFPPGTIADTVTVSTIKIRTDGTGDDQRVRIAEVVLYSGVGEDVSTLDMQAPVARDCIDLGLRIGRENEQLRPVLVRVDGSIGQLLASDPVAFETCEPVVLGRGANLLESANGSPLDEVALIPSAPQASVTVGSGISVSWERRSADRLDGILEGRGPATLSLRTSFDPGWELELDGQRIEATNRDTANSWTVEATGSTQFSIRYEPARQLRRALLVTIVGLLLCSMIAIWSRGRRQEVDPESPDPDVTEPDVTEPSRTSWRNDVVPVAIATVIGLALLGPIALGVGAVTIVLLRYVSGASDNIGLAPPLIVGMAAMWSALAYPAVPVSLAYANLRWAPSALVQVAIVFLIQAMCLAVRDVRVGGRSST